MDLDGNNLVRLTDNPASDKEPAWSPDGNRITFSTDRNGSFDIYVMSVERFLGGIGTPAVQRVTTSLSEEMGPAGGSAP